MNQRPVGERGREEGLEGRRGVCVCVGGGGRGGMKLRRNEPGHGYSAQTQGNLLEVA